MEIILESLLNKILSLLKNEEEFKSKLDIFVKSVLWINLPAGLELLDQLNSNAQFSIFDNHLQYLGTGGSSTDIKDLAVWLVVRSFEVGSNKAIEELNFYVNSKEVTVYEILLLASLNIDTEYKFCNGVEIIYPDNLPNTYLATNILNNMYTSLLPIPRVSSLLMFPFIQDIYHIPNTEYKKWSNKPKIPLEKFEETLLCSSLVRPIDYGIHGYAHGTIAPDNLPFIKKGMGWGIIPSNQSRSSPILLDINCLQADKLLNKFINLPNDIKNKLFISMKRLNGLGSGNSFEDKAIDLRICLESIFLGDGNKNQLKFTLSLRASLFLGNTLIERKRILKLFKKAYDITSYVVHNGELPKKKTNEKIDIVFEVAELAKEAIKKIIENGYPIWENVELQAPISK